MSEGDDKRETNKIRTSERLVWACCRWRWLLPFLPFLHRRRRNLVIGLDEALSLSTQRTEVNARKNYSAIPGYASQKVLVQVVVLVVQSRSPIHSITESWTGSQ